MWLNWKFDIKLRYYVDKTNSSWQNTKYRNQMIQTVNKCTSWGILIKYSMFVFIYLASLI